MPIIISIAMSVLVFIFPISGNAQNIYRQIIPFVTTGCDITIQNGEPNRQTIRISFASKVESYTVDAYRVLRLKAPESGYVLIESDRTDIHSWAVVQGATFAGIKLNTQSRMLPVTASTGIVVVNPWNEIVRVTFWMYDADNGFVHSYRNFTLSPGTFWIGFFKDIVAMPSLPNGFLVNILSERPIAIGAAECNARCETLPVAGIGIREVLK